MGFVNLCYERYGIIKSTTKVVLDQKLQIYYNHSMIRKKRNDRTHIIYCIESENDFYIGVTAKTESTVKKSVIVRCNKHRYRMQSEEKSWALYEVMRERGLKNFSVKVLDVIRGKSAAHQVERELIRKLKPTLNTDIRERQAA